MLIVGAEIEKEILLCICRMSVSNTMTALVFTGESSLKKELLIMLAVKNSKSSCFSS